MAKNNLTLVTALYDLGRDKLDPGFKRGFDHYKECFAKLLKTELPMIIYCDKDVEKFVWEHRKSNNTRIISKSLDQIKREFPFFKETNKIRKSKVWLRRAGWLPGSPQAKLEMYNPLVMSKQFMLNDASIFNFFNTKYFLWIDAGIANTIGDPTRFFNLEYQAKLTRNMNKMMYLCFPYDGKVEVHGFEKKKFNKYAGEETNRVARGGMFGGTRSAINDVNAIYYQLLNDTLKDGLMGTEESIFTLITYRNPELCNIRWIEGNGLIIKALEDIENINIDVNSDRLAIYALTFNLPKQFEYWVKSFIEAYPNDFENSTKYVINNSTRKDVEKEYNRLFEKYGFIEFKFNNIGICGGRQFAAEHFAESSHDYMVFFEDDMLLHTKKGTCDSGFTTHQDDLFDKCMDIMENEELDYLKLAFTEFFGTNHDNWAWHNVSKEKQDEYFKSTKMCPNRKKTKIFYTGSHRLMPYAVGEYHYCNWPVMFNKKGNQKVFLDTKFEHKYEQIWMANTFELMRQEKLKAGSLLATVINHHRKWHYNRGTRRENEHYSN